MTSEDREATILSIDGIGAYDLVSRNAMFRGRWQTWLTATNWSRSCACSTGHHQHFSGSEGTVHHVRQGEGGEQGDPLMPLLFSLGLHQALVSVKSQLEDGEKLFAFLDDVCVIGRPTRVLQVFRLLEHELSRKACICVHQGKAQIWNRGEVEPAGATQLTTAARIEKTLWCGEEIDRAGLTVFCAPVGQLDFVQAQGAEHQALLEMIEFPMFRVRGCSFCSAGARANFLLRTVQPELTQDFASHHDEQLARCLRRVLHIDTMPLEVQVAASMPLTLGGLGMGNSERTRDAAHWGSWADCLEMIKI